MTWLQGPWPVVKVEDVLRAFPADVRHLMPDWDEIPDEFKQAPRHPFVAVADTWFLAGLNADVKFWLNPGIDGDEMIRHLQCVMGSYQPKHQHKIASVAFLLSKWCNKIEDYEP